jgi:hypothetical protein
MVEGESDHRETQRRLGLAGQGINVRDHETVGTHAFTRDLYPSGSRRRLSWVASHFALTRSWEPTGDVLQAACWPGSCFAL